MKVVANHDEVNVPGILGHDPPGALTTKGEMVLGVKTPLLLVVATTHFLILTSG